VPGLLEVAVPLVIFATNAAALSMTLETTCSILPLTLLMMALIFVPIPLTLKILDMKLSATGMLLARLDSTPITAALMLPLAIAATDCITLEIKLNIRCPSDMKNFTMSNAVMNNCTNPPPGTNILTNFSTAVWITLFLTSVLMPSITSLLTAPSWAFMPSAAPMPLVIRFCTRLTLDSAILVLSSPSFLTSDFLKFT